MDYQKIIEQLEADTEQLDDFSGIIDTLEEIKQDGVAHKFDTSEGVEQLESRLNDVINRLIEIEKFYS